VSALGIFLVTAPGLEAVLAAEARDAGFDVLGTVAGGVTLAGGWPEAWRANLDLRGAVRVLVRVAEFRAMHLAQLDKRARKLPWGDWLRTRETVRVEAVCRKSRIYHDKAAAQRIEGALAANGFTVKSEGTVSVKLRIEDDLATVSLDTTGEALHRRGLKEKVHKAPMRETLAALFLRAAGYVGTGTVLDPMCGSGTFVIEAAEIAAGLQPGRARGFAFQRFPSFDPDAFEAMRRSAPVDGSVRLFGSDRDTGAVAMARANAERAGVEAVTRFDHTAIGDLTPPDAPPGLVILNPPYGGRLGKNGPLTGLYAAFGEVMRSRFSGWRVAMVTSEAGLARASGLHWEAPGSIVDNGGIKVRLWQARI
jgi:putative N6-adenine-specific DNA methylase